MRRLAAFITAVTLASTGLLITSPTPSSAGVADRAGETRTPFALKANGYGTRVRGGEVPAGSDTTAFQVIGCTNRAGLDERNHEAAVTVPDLGTLSGVTTKVWTRRNKEGVVSSNSRHSIARLRIGNPDDGVLDIHGIKSRSRAFHDDSGFHAETETHVGSITFTPADGEPQELPLPTPDQPVTIPDFAEITVGDHTREASGERALAVANTLRIEVFASGSRALVAHSYARISRGIKSGIFNGWSAGIRGEGIDGNLTKGRTPLSVMPCQGTHGDVRDKAIASLNLGDNIVAGAVQSEQMAVQNNKRARGYERGSVGTLNLGNGQLVVDAVIGKANVTRVGNKVKRTAKGTSIGTILVNGEEESFPPTDVLEIPGLARLEQRIVKKTKSGISVTALRITLLDGTGAVIDLGLAKLRIRDSGR